MLIVSLGYDSTTSKLLGLFKIVGLSRSWYLSINYLEGKDDEHNISGALIHKLSTCSPNIGSRHIKDVVRSDPARGGSQADLVKTFPFVGKTPFASKIANLWFCSTLRRAHFM